MNNIILGLFAVGKIIIKNWNTRNKTDLSTYIARVNQTETKKLI